MSSAVARSGRLGQWIRRNTERAAFVSVAKDSATSAGVLFFRKSFYDTHLRRPYPLGRGQNPIYIVVKSIDLATKSIDLATKSIDLAAKSIDLAAK
jgi:hypothetical protein